jgi:hypothetical protein
LRYAATCTVASIDKLVRHPMRGRVVLVFAAAVMVIGVAWALDTQPAGRGVVGELLVGVAAATTLLLLALGPLQVLVCAVTAARATYSRDGVFRYLHRPAGNDAGGRPTGGWAFVLATRQGDDAISARGFCAWPRGRGLGEALLKDILAEVDTHDLEVRIDAGNKWLADVVYRPCGFDRQPRSWRQLPGQVRMIRRRATARRGRARGYAQ